MVWYGCFLSEIDAFAVYTKISGRSMETATRLTELAVPLPIPLLLNTEATSTSTKTSPGQLTHLGEQICFKYLLPLSSNYSDHPLFQTLVHQIGHSLGLSHSNVYDSVMFPFVKTFNASSPLNFHREDIKAIQTLYGEKTGGVDLSIAQEAASGNKIQVLFFVTTILGRNQKGKEPMFRPFRRHNLPNC